MNNVIKQTNMTMKIKIWFVILVIIPMFGGETAEAATAIIDDTVVVDATGVVPLTPGPLLDDFRYAAGINVWRDVTGTFSKYATPPPDAICTISYTDDTPPFGHSLQLDYDVTRPESFSGYFSKLGGASLGAYTTISFWVKGASGGEYFKIELKNNSTTKYWDSTEGTHYYRNSAAVYITDYLDGGVTTSWQKVTIPLHNFANLDGWTSMKEFVIVFENYQSGINGSPKDSILYIDNISFSSDTPVGVVRIDHFGDKVGTCALGGNIGDFPGDGGTAQYSFTSVEGTYHNSSNAMLSEYDVTTGYAGHFIVFGGGNADDNLGAVEKPEKMGWIKIPHNFSSYQYLTFWVRAESVTKNPEGVKIELVTNDPWGGYFWVIPGTITTSWKKYALELDGLSLTTVKQMNFVYEKWRIDGWGGDRAGTLYIDEIQFETSQYYQSHPDTSPLLAPTRLRD